MIAILIGLPAATVTTSVVTVLLLCGWIVLLKITCPERTAESDAPCQPPMASGLPVVGSALALGRGGATYLQACRARHGDTFTLRLPGQRMTFLLSPHSIPFFFKAPDSLLSFAPAVEQFTFRVFGLPPCDFLPKHHLLMDTLRGQVGTRDVLPQHASRLLSLVLRDMHTFATSAQCLHNDACSSVSDNTGRVVDLFEAVKAFLFPVAVESLFGAAFVHRHGASALQDAFFALDEGFEMAASPIPHILQPSFCKAKRYLIEALRKSHAAGDFCGSVVENLIQKCKMPERSIPNMLLAVLWASQANTVPATFWALAFLLLPAHAKHLSEAMHWLRSSPPSSKATLSNKTPRLSNADEHALIEAACDPESPLRKCCLEAVRLRSPSIDVRVAAADVAVPCGDAQYMQIPKGSVVAISPWMTHLDPRAFERPRDYDPNRNGITIPVARDRALEGRGHVSSSSTAMHAGGAGVGGVGGVAFGGGRYRCPGRGFAEMELALVVGAVLACWRLELCRLEKNLPGFEAWPGDSDGLLPPPNVRKMVGIKVPSRPCWVHV